MSPNDQFADALTPVTMNRRDFATTLSVGALAWLGASSRTAAESPKSLAVQWAAPRSLNPLFSTAGSEQQIERAIFGVLVRMMVSPIH